MTAANLPQMNRVSRGRVDHDHVSSARPAAALDRSAFPASGIAGDAVAAPGATGPVVCEALEPRQLLHGGAIDPIAAQTVPIGKPLEIPITADYDHPDALRYSVISSSPAVSASFHPASNTWIDMEVLGFGTMRFQLFDDLAPEAVRRVTGLVNAGFYDGLSFFKVMNNFILQGGDPAGDGTGGPKFRFDDEFNANSALFTGDGQLALAKPQGRSDENGSQFFITQRDPLSGPPRFLDFNHTIFGQLVDGFNVRNAISQVAVDATDRPNVNVQIDRVAVVQNTRDAVLEVRGLSSGTATLTVTSQGAQGTAQQTFQVTAAADTTGTPPVLANVKDVYYTPADTPITIRLSSLDLENSPVQYGAVFSVDAQNGATGGFTDDGTALVVTPAKGYVGPVRLLVGVKEKDASSRGSTERNPNLPLGGIYDSQEITIAVGDSPVGNVAGVDVDAPAGTTTGTVLLGTFTDTDKAARPTDWTASVDWGDDAPGVGRVIQTGTGTFGVYGDHTYARAGTFPLTVRITGNKGATATAQGRVTARNMATLAGYTVTVQGGSGNDIIGISRHGSKYNVNVNGTIKQYNVSQVYRFDVYGYGGGDLMAIGGSVPGSYLFGDDGDDVMYGGDYNDTLSGGAGKNILYGNNGNDRLNGSNGPDYCYGGNGDDRLYGNGGNDHLEGNAGVDRIWGGAGDDLISGGSGNDKIWGDLGVNTLYGGAGADRLDGSLGIDYADNDPADTRIAIDVLL